MGSVKIQFYPLDLAYKIVDNKVSILLFGRTVDKKVICVIDDQFLPYFYLVLEQAAASEEIRQKWAGLEHKDGNTIMKVLAVEPVQKRYVGKEKPVLKVTVNHPRAVPHFRELLAAQKDVAQVIEADIQFTKRYLIDKGITPLMLCEAEGEPATAHVKADITIKAESIKQISEDIMPEPNVIAFDIETYNPIGKNMIADKFPILMVSFYGKHFQKVLVWKSIKTTHEYVEQVKSEEELIRRFKEVLDRLRPDILCGYFTDGFDWPYIRRRAEQYNIKLDIGLDYSSPNFSSGSTTTVKLAGMSHVDIFKFVQGAMSATLQTDALDLDSVAQELLGEGKTEVDVNSLAQCWDSNSPELERFCEYNLQDSKLTWQLTEKLLPNMIELVKVVGLTLYDIARMGMSQFVEWYLIRNAQHEHELTPNKPDHGAAKERMMSTYEGGFVFEPKPGFYEDIGVFDFRSLYPTIIASHNISPATMNCSCCEGKNMAPVENRSIWFCQREKGFIPKILGDLIERRGRIKVLLKNKEDKILRAREYTLKILANSFYGYLGFFAARWYSLDCAQATTAYGRHYIRSAIEQAQNEGFTVLYGDTDSVFLSLKGKSRKEALEFVDAINKKLPPPMELDLEGFYPRGIFVSAKVGSYGAKKKYALLGEEGIIKIRGFETVRRNWSLIAKEVQEEVLRIILKEKDVQKAKEYVQDTVHQLRKNLVPLDKVIIYTKLQKELSSYDQIGPHVAMAKKMQQKGMYVGQGTLISYVIVKGKEMIRDRAQLPTEVKQEQYDPDYYIEHQVIPGVDRIFAVLGIRPEALSERKGQKGLGEFFV